MVHALRESWRVLRNTGTLIDLRPLSTVFPIEAVTGPTAAQIGEGSAAATAGDERAAERALAIQIRDGALVPRHEARFEVRLYWDTTAAMAEYMRTGRTAKQVKPAYDEIDAALRAAADRSGTPASLRATRPMTIGSYSKGPGA